MSYRGTGGTAAGDDARSPVDVAEDGLTEAELDDLRRTHPRRAARIEERRAALARQEQGRGPAPAPDDAVFDQYADAPQPAPPHDTGWVDGTAATHEDGWVEEHHEEWAATHPGAGEPLAHREDWDGAHPDDADHDPFGDPVADGYVAPEAWAAPAPRRRRRGAGLLALVVVVAIVGTAGWFAYQGLRPVIGDIQAFDLFSAPEDYEGAGQGSVEVVVSPGDRGPQMGRTLADADVVASVEAFISAANAEPRFTSIQPGTYTLAQQMSAAEAVQALLDPANRVTDQVTIREGLRAEQVLALLAEELQIPEDELREAALAAELPPEAQLPADVDAPPPAVGEIEGWLAAETYQFPPDATASQVIDTMVAQTVTTLERLQVPREEWLETLTRASLVQAEARLPEDFGRVARVIDNRIESGVPTADGGVTRLLQLDATTNYATGIYDTFTTDEQRSSPSPYNTYRAQGLPPGPIGSPSRAAIEAVVDPPEGPWLFYVAVNLCTGETVYAETFEEHQQNVDVLTAWIRENQNDDGTYDCG